MILYCQEPGTSICGQCVVGMLTGVTLLDVLNVMGEGRNYPRDLRNGLKTFGYDFVRSRSTPLQDGEKPPAGQPAVVWCELPVSADRHAQHWIAWDGQQFFDPLNGIHDQLPSDWKTAYYLVAKL